MSEGEELEEALELEEPGHSKLRSKRPLQGYS